MEKRLSITSLYGDEKLSSLPPDLPVERLVIWYGEILSTWNFQIQQPGRIKTVDNNRPLKRLSEC